MATLSDLVGAVANVTGLPEATVFAYGRFAREAGLISQAGRGRGGAKMTPTDAANLIIAIGGTRVTREAGAAIRTLRALRGRVSNQPNEPREPVKSWIEGFLTGQDRTGSFELGQFMDFLIGETMTSRFEALIRSLPAYNLPRPPDPNLEEARKRYESDPSSVLRKAPKEVDLLGDFDLTLSFSSPQTVYFDIKSAPFVGGNDYLTLTFGRYQDDPHAPDLDTYTTLRQRTIFAVGRCLADRDLAEMRR